MTSYFAPLRAKTAEPLALNMQSLFLSGRVLPFGAKLSVTHVFRSSEKTPVEVIYCFPLPRDASLVSFQISGETFSISSRLEPAADARKRYEQALYKGSLAALTRQNLDGLVNLTVGNLRPGEIVTVRLDLVAGVSLNDSGFRLRFPFTVAPCYHPQMRVSQDEPGVGRMELPDHVAGGVVLSPVHSDASHLHRIGFCLQVEPSNGISEIASPSHAVRVLLNERGTVGVKLSPGRDVPNRDLVLDVKHDLDAGRAWAKRERSSSGRKTFALIVPSTVFGQPPKTTRRVVFLLDRSGSMSGSPIQQARHAIENCLAKLSPEDQFGIVVFDDSAEFFRESTLAATRDHIEEACAFLSTIHARGGTELARGVEAAAQLLIGSPGEIFIVTDGQVFETVEILRRARKCEVRLFCLGIGSAGQDRFLQLLARQTGGV
ncbi:MAG: VIT domain-containing protein, partial [Bryobacteraceae bacterium]